MGSHNRRIYPDVWFSDLIVAAAAGARVVAGHLMVHDRLSRARLAYWTQR